MSFSTPHNAITQRLGKLTDLYEQFYKNTDAKICYWLLEADEFPMIEQFVKIETSIDASFPDLIIKFQGSFEDQQSYGRHLVNELDELVQWYKMELGAQGETTSWSPVSVENATHPEIFLKNLSLFGSSLEDLDDPVVAYIAPQFIKDYKQMEQWLIQVLKSEVPDNVRFMIVDFIDNQIFRNLPELYADKVMTLKPALDMSQAMKELALAGGSTHPGTQFQSIYIDLSNAATKGQMEKVEHYASKALEIVVAEGWFHLQVAVHTTVGAAWTHNKDNEKALMEYEKAIKAANLAIKKEEAIGPKLLANSLFAKASVLINMKAFEQALEVYEEIVPITEAEQDYYLTMEAWRMAGFCLERDKKPENAFGCYEKAVENAALLEKEVLQNSTLPYTGMAMLKINDDHYNDFQKEQWIEERLTTLVGENWKSEVSQTKN
jgi:tetratricopeptide (TPR) repeat protein